MATVLPDYVHEFPSASITTLVSIVRNSEYAARASEFVKHSHVLLGYGAYLRFGEPGQAMAVEEFTVDDELEFDDRTDEQRMDLLEEYASVGDGDTMMALPVPAALLIKWFLVNVVIPKLLDLLSKK